MGATEPRDAVSDAWDNPAYGEIDYAAAANGTLDVRFRDGTAVAVPLEALGLSGVPQIEASVQAGEPGVVRLHGRGVQDRAIPWTALRAATDERFAQYLRDSDAREARRVGARLRALREDRGVPQKEVARQAGMSPPQLAKIERGEADMRISTVTRLLRVLGADWADISGPSPPEVSVREIQRRAVRFGAPRSLVRRIAERVKREDFAEALCRGFGWSRESLLNERGEVDLWTSSGVAIQFKAARNQRRTASPVAEFARNICVLVSENSERPQWVRLPPDPWTIRDQMTSASGELSFRTMLEWAWTQGVTTVPIEARGGFHAAVWSHESGPLVALKQPQDLSVFWAFDFAHELGHIALGHLGADDFVEENVGEDDDDREAAANEFARTLLLGDWEALIMTAVEKANRDVRELKRATREVARDRDVSPGTLGTILARRIQVDGQEGQWWGAAINLAREEGSARRIAVEALAHRLSVEPMSDLEKGLVGAATGAV